MTFTYPQCTSPEIVGALERALAANDNGQPSYIEFICQQYPVYGQWVTSSHGE